VLARRETGELNAARLLADGERMTVHEAVTCAVALADRIASTPAGQEIRPGRAAQPARPAPDGTSPAGGSTRRAGPAPPALTAREWQIAALIARGLSNRGIAAELVISPATAARHVANIFGKLGVSSRAQVAAWIAERRPDSR
jgi:DNA-binding NarL/FixJ family response regulator